MGRSAPTLARVLARLGRMRSDAQARSDAGKSRTLASIRRARGERMAPQASLRVKLGMDATKPMLSRTSLHRERSVPARIAT